MPVIVVRDLGNPTLLALEWICGECAAVVVSHPLDRRAALAGTVHIAAATTATFARAWLAHAHTHAW